MFFKKSKQKLEAMETYQSELDMVKQELEGFKSKVESDLGSIKKDFKELIVLLQESPDEEDELAEADRKDERTPAKIINEILGQSELDEMRTDVTSIFEKVITIARQTDETAKTLAKFKDTTYSELKSIKSNIDNARKDINNKIKYSISRLRT